MSTNDLNWNIALSEITAAITSIITVVLAYRLQMRKSEYKDDEESTDE